MWTMIWEKMKRKNEWKENSCDLWMISKLWLNWQLIKILSASQWSLLSSFLLYKQARSGEKRHDYHNNNEHEGHDDLNMRTTPVIWFSWFIPKRCLRECPSFHQCNRSQVQPIGDISNSPNRVYRCTWVFINLTEL